MDFRSEMLAARVRRLRLSKRLSIEQLAKIAEVDKNTIVRIEKGEGRPNLKTLVNICNALDVSADHLMEMKTKENEDFFVFRKSEKSTDESEPGLKVGNLKAKLPYGNINAVVLELSGEGKMRSHIGEEIVFCLKGNVGIMIGNTSIELKKGDSVMFFGREPHKYFNADKSNKPEISVALCVWLDESIDMRTNYLESYHI